MDDLERQEGIDQKEGPTLRTASNSMRAFTGAGMYGHGYFMYVCMNVYMLSMVGDFGSETVGMRSARLSVVGGDSLGNKLTIIQLIVCI